MACGRVMMREIVGVGHVRLHLAFGLPGNARPFNIGSMKFLPTAIALLVGAMFMISSSAQAAGKSRTKSPAPVADTSDKITAVHLASITINLFATSRPDDSGVRGNVSESLSPYPLTQD